MAFRELLSRIHVRLQFSKVIQNLAHPDRPPITKTSSDNNVVELQNRCKESLDKLRELDRSENNNADAARVAWDWIFRSDGFFKEFDENLKRDEKEKALIEKAALIGNGARTSFAGVIGMIGVTNLPHKFYGDSPHF